MIAANKYAMTMRRYMSLLGEQAPSVRSNFLHDLQALTEGAADRYLQMFRGFPNEEGAKREVQWARETFKRDDRIIWYLRWSRLHLLQGLIAGASPEATPNLQKVYDRMMRDMAGRTKLDPAEITKAAAQTDSYRWKQNLAHIVSMFAVVPEMNAYQFDAQTPAAVEADMERIEQEFASTSGKNIRPTEENPKAEKIIDFGNGFAWWNLHQPSCREEADAMGHCGNTATPRRGQKLLSLRQRIMKGNKPFDLPCLTFILDKNGLLGEMKGRANTKPNEKYHKYIVALLQSNLVRGVRGGGYARANNFSLKDLPEADREKLLAKRPGLDQELTLDDAVSKMRNYYGFDAAEHMEVGKDEAGQDVVIVWKGAISDIPGGKYFGALEDLVDKIKETPVDVSDRTLYDMLHHLNADALGAIARMVGFDSPPSGHDPHYVNRLHRAVAHSDRFKAFVIKCANDTNVSASPFTKDAIAAFIKHYIPLFVSLKQDEGIDLELLIPEDPIGGEYRVKMWAQTAEILSEYIETIEAADESRHGDYSYEDDDEDDDVDRNRDDNTDDEVEDVPEEIRSFVNQFRGGWFDEYSSDSDISWKIERDADQFDENPIDPKIARYLKKAVDASSQGRHRSKSRAAIGDEPDAVALASAVERAVSRRSDVVRPKPEEMDDLFKNQKRRRRS